MNPDQNAAAAIRERRSAVRVVKSSIVGFAVGLLLPGRIAAQTQPAFPDPSGPFEVAPAYPFCLLEAERRVLSDAEIQQVGMTRAQADAWITSLVNVQTTMLARSRGARSRKLERSKHNTSMTDLLFFTTALPAARRTALVGDVDPTTAFAEISTWIGEFMATHVARAAAQR